MTKFISSTGELNVGKSALLARFVKDKAISPGTLEGEKFSFKWVNIADKYQPKVKQPLYHLQFAYNTSQRNLTSGIFLSSTGQLYLNFIIIRVRATVYQHFEHGNHIYWHERFFVEHLIFSSVALIPTDPHNTPFLSLAAFLTQTVHVGGTPVMFEIWDTAGQERYHSLAPIYYRGAGAAIVVYSTTDETSFDRAKQWIEELRLGFNPDMIIALAGNTAADPSSKRVVKFEVIIQH